MRVRVRTQISKGATKEKILGEGEREREVVREGEKQRTRESKTNMKS